MREEKEQGMRFGHFAPAPKRGGKFFIWIGSKSLECLVSKK
jgi:hypothetical protein